MSKKNKAVGIVYSTNPNFAYNFDESDETETLENHKQDLRVWLDSKSRGGKTATLIKGFVGTDADLNDLAKKLKNHCGTGGSAKEGEIIIQGDQREKVLNYLLNNKYKAKKAGG